MGSLKRFKLDKIAKEYQASYFIETGTSKGEGVAYALETPFTKIISIEIMPSIAEQARERFRSFPAVEIITGPSVAALASTLPAVNGNCIFWLDAHFPGADEGVIAYDAEENEDFRLPLEKEIETIRSRREGFRDILIIDDLRIYEEGPYENGNAPADTLPKNARNIDFLDRYYGQSHIIEKSFLDEGYILAFPKKQNSPQPSLAQYVN